MPHNSLQNIQHDIITSMMSDHTATGEPVELFQVVIFAGSFRVSLFIDLGRREIWKHGRGEPLALL